MELRPGYKRTEAGIVPMDWLDKSVGGMMQFVGGSQPEKSVFRSSDRNGYIRLIQIRDYKTDKYKTFVPERLARRFCSETDIMIGRYGPPIFQILRGLRGAYNVALIKALPTQDLNNTYAYYFLKQGKLFSFIEKLSRRTSGQTGVDLDELRSYPMPLPPTKAEQEEIAEALSNADAYIESLEQLITKKRLIKQGAMQELFTGKQRLPGFSGEWQKIALREIGSTYGGLTGKTKTDFGDGNAQYIPFMNVMSNVIISPEDLGRVKVLPVESQNQVLRGDLLLNGSSETPEEVAMCSVFTEDIPDLYLNSFCFGFRLNANRWANGLYLAYYLRSNVGRELIKSLAQGSTRYNLSKIALLKLELKLPELPEQLAISNTLSDMELEIDALEVKLVKVLKVKQGMMQELLTGRIRLV